MDSCTQYRGESMEPGSAVVLGLGSSGAAAARLLLSESAPVIAVDSNRSEELESTAASLRAAGARVMLGCERLPSEPIGYVVVSPGLPPDSPLRVAADSRGLATVAELELGWSRIGAPTIAVTGSNGKSSIVKLISEILISAGKGVAVGGNYGTPACKIALQRERPDWLLLEVSSFQLETIVEFRADVAVLLNLFPNHLDRHKSMYAYRKLKERIFENSEHADHCILPQELADTVTLPKDGPNWTAFGCEAGADWRYCDGAVSWCSDSSQRWHRGSCSARTRARNADRVDLSGTYFDNEVLGSAAAAVIAVCDAAGIDPVRALDPIREFEPLPHRMQLVAELSGVKFIDDSKATNLAALIAALKMSSAPVRLIAGGLAKENDFGAAIELLRGKTSKVYLIGSAADTMAEAWTGAVNCEVCGELGRAVERSFSEAEAGDTILLAPGCASFDQFANFSERGELFNKYIKGLAKHRSI